MIRYRLCFVVVLAATGCPDGDDAVTNAMTAESGSTSGSTGGTTVSTSTADTSSGVTTSMSTTCVDECPTSSETTLTTEVDSSSSSGSSGTTEGTSTSPESSSSEGPPGICGNGIVEGGEDCDDMAQTATCDSDCTDAVCGDAHLNALAGETCDAGGESFSCDVDCTAVMCGDGIANASHNEDCDDGGSSPTCDTDCTSPICGDDVLNVAALETCDDGGTDDDDGCSSDCYIEGDNGGQCRIVDGRQWCFDDDNCGQACDDVCTTLGLTIEPDDGLWFDAQDTLAECQAISDAFGIGVAAQLDGPQYGCLEDAGNDDTVGGGLTGPLSCSTDPTCPGSHRTQMDDLGGICNLPDARRSVCPCEGAFCGNALVEPGEDCDDGNQVNGDGCTSGCLTTPPSCVNVGGLFWCYDPNACGQACNDVCSALGLSLDISDADWVAAQDSMLECQAIADAFGMLGGVSVSAYSYACAEEQSDDDVPNMGIQGLLYCSTDGFCPNQHRTNMDNIGIDCPVAGSFRSICPCN